MSDEPIVNFLFPTIFWYGLPLLALPVLIHLLQLRRRQSIPWAAMQFLAESQRQNRTWIRLKELLLIALRTLAVAGILLAIAGPLLGSNWFQGLFARPAHHVILLDDTLSMSARADESHWARAIGAVKSIIVAAGDASPRNAVSIYRTSEIEPDQEPNESLVVESLTPLKRSEVLAKLDTWNCSEAGRPLAQALTTASQVARPRSEGQDVVVHVVSDFTRSELRDVEALAPPLNKLKELATRVELVECAPTSLDNLGIAMLAPESGALAAGVEAWMRLAVSNFGREPAQRVVVEIEQDGSPLSSIEFPEIGPGDTQTQRFRIRIASPGPHSIVANLPPDAMAGDNTRYFAVDLPAKRQILLIDGSPRNREAFYVTTALTPEGVLTPWSVETVSPTQLDDSIRWNDLAAVGLFDVDRLSDTQRNQIEEFVRAGGGLLVSLGESIDREYYTQSLHRQGAGLLPVAPTLPTQYVRPQDASSSDVTLASHPALTVFSGQRNSLIDLLRVNYYWAVDANWQSMATGAVILASLPSGEPLLIEYPFGAGHTIVQLGPIAPTSPRLGSWNNWATSPSFSIVMNELFSHVARRDLGRSDLRVGETWTESVSSSDFVPTARLVGVSTSKAAGTDLIGTPNDMQLAFTTPPLASTGVYRLELTRTGGENHTHMIAVNPSPEESDLQIATNSPLRQRFADDRLQVVKASDLSSTRQRQQSSSLADGLLVVLALVLVGEQALAMACSYHR